MKKIVVLLLILASTCIGDVVIPRRSTPFRIPRLGPSVMVAASDSAPEFKSIADYVCDGTDDEDIINPIIAAMATSGGGKIMFADGTYNIWTYINLRAGVSGNPATPTNIILEGQGWDTVLEREVHSGTADSYDTTTLNATTSVFTTGMAADGSAVQFDTSGNLYDIVTVTDGDTVVLDADCSGEAASDTFKISTVYHVIWQTGAGNNVIIQDLAVNGNDFGEPTTANNKGIFFNGNNTDWTTCHHMKIDNVYAYNTESEALCIDYSQYMDIVNCRTANSAWAGTTLAQVKFGSMQNNYVFDPGNGDIANNTTAGINCQNSSHILISNNVVEGAKDGGIWVCKQNANNYPSCYVVVRDNHIIKQQAVTTSLGHIIIDSDNAAARVSYVDILNNTITRNLMKGSGSTWFSDGEAGIYVDRANGVSVVGNKIFGFGNTALYLNSNADYVKHDDNYTGEFYTNSVYTHGSATNITAGTNYALTADIAVTSSKSLRENDLSRAYDNTGAGGIVQITLPPAYKGMVVKFTIAAAQQLRVYPQSTETLNSTVGGAQGTAGQFCYSATIGHTITFLCESDGVWSCQAVTGTWTIAG